MGDDKATVKVFRYDPVVDEEPRYDVFRGVPYQGSTVLDVLTYIHEHFDSSLVFRRSCRGGICDICMVKVNGKSALSCKKMAEKEMTIDPPRMAGLIRDLVVELTMGRKGRSDRTSDD